MGYNCQFGPAARTCAQRAWVLLQRQEAIPRLQTGTTAAAHQLYAQYVAGELSWPQVRQALDAATLLT